MPEPVHFECSLTGDMKSRLCAERPCLRQRICTHMSPFNPPRQPLPHEPRKRRLAPRVILHHELSARCQQSPQPRQHRYWSGQVVQHIRARDQVKGLWSEWKSSCLASTDLSPLQPHVRPVVQGSARLCQHVGTCVHPIRFRIGDAVEHPSQQDTCPAGNIQHARWASELLWHASQPSLVNQRQCLGQGPFGEGAPAGVVVPCPLSRVIAAHTSLLKLRGGRVPSHISHYTEPSYNRQGTICNSRNSMRPEPVGCSRASHWFCIAGGKGTRHMRALVYHHAHPGTPALDGGTGTDRSISLLLKEVQPGYVVGVNLLRDARP